jgi:hypothetical protein
MFNILNKYGSFMAKVQTRKPLKCEDCGAVLKKVNYTMWGTKKFDPTRGNYVEDESLGESDLEFTCPSCSAKLEPDEKLF